MVRCKVVIPPLLLIMLFLRAFTTVIQISLSNSELDTRTLKTTTINLIVDEVNHHDTFIIKEPRHGDKSSKTLSRVLAAASAHTDNAGTVWNSPFN
jgi:hypothetical protein